MAQLHHKGNFWLSGRVEDDKLVDMVLEEVWLDKIINPAKK
jgi:hypothetical protein